MTQEGKLLLPYLLHLCSWTSADNSGVCADAKLENKKAALQKVM